MIQKKTWTNHGSDTVLQFVQVFLNQTLSKILKQKKASYVTLMYQQLRGFFVQSFHVQILPSGKIKSKNENPNFKFFW